MLKLRFSKPLRRQYMDGKVSVCKYECVVFDSTTKGIIAQFTTSGTAKCAPSDTVNPDFGIKLADSRAKLKAYQVAANLISPAEMHEMIKECQSQMEFIAFIGQMQFLKKKEIEHIKVVCEEA